MTGSMIESKSKEPSKLKILDFGKKKPEEEFIGLCTSPRSKYGDKIIGEKSKDK